jgi:hypothetical protein
MNTNSKDILTPDEVLSLSEEQTKYKKLPTINIFGKNISTENLIVSVIGIIMWVIIWKIFNLFDTGSFSSLFFISFIVFDIINIFTTSTNTEVNVTESNYRLQNQLNISLGILGAIIILLSFLYKFEIDKIYKEKAFNLLTVITSILCLSLLTFGVKNDSEEITVLRFIVEDLQSMGIILIILLMYVLYLGNKK